MMPHYSQRLSWALGPNELARVLAEKRGQGTPVLDLTGSNPTLGAEYPHEEIRRSLADIPDFSYLPDARGLLVAREAIADFHRNEGFNLSPSRILLTASTSEAYSLLFKLFCDPGDEVLAPVPSYPLFEYLAAAEGVRIVPYALRYDGSWSIDFEHLRAQISERSRAIVIVNPNNPTGSFLKEPEWEQLADLACTHAIPVIADEVFMCYAFGEAPARIRSLIGDDRVLSFCLNGLSKAAGMPQMKLAWIVVNGPPRDRALAIERLELLLDTYLSVSTPVQRAAPHLLQIGAGIRRGLQTTAAQNLRCAQECLVASPVSIMYTEGGWSTILHLPGTRTEDEWLADLLINRNVLLQPGFFFDMHAGAFAIASLITNPEIFAFGIRQLREFIQC